MSAPHQYAAAFRATAIPQYTPAGDFASHSGLPNPTDSAQPLPPSDVETTNWNAVKMLASKYGITLKSAADIQNSASERARECEAQGLADGNAMASDDLGVGTPFEITATKLEGGRFIYRFKWRGNPASEAAGQSGSQSGVASSSFPRSVSSGAIINASRTVRDESALFGHGKSSKNGPFGLKSSRSIPVLRGNRPGSGSSRNMFAGDAPASDPPAGGASSPFQHLTRSGESRSYLDGQATSGPSAWRGGLGGSVQPPSITSTSARPTNAGSVAMARAESTPVKGAYAQRNWTGRLEEGDVLGAILGFRHEAVWTTASSDKHDEAEQQEVLRSPDMRSGTSLQPDPHTPPRIEGSPVFPASVRPFGSEVLLQPSTTSQRTKRSSPAQYGQRSIATDEAPSASTEGLLPELDLGSKFAKSPRLRQLREAPSSTSMASDATAKGDAASVSTADGTPCGTPSHTSAVASGIMLFDVLQEFARPTQRSSLEGSMSHRLTQTDSISSHRRFNSADLLTSQITHNLQEAQKHFIAEAQSLPTSAAPGDDPRFALWAVRSVETNGVLVAAGRQGETSASQSVFLGSPVRASGGGKSNGNSRTASLSLRGIDDGPHRARHQGKSGTHDGRQSFDARSDLFPSGKAVLLAATPARLVAEITSEIDHGLLTDFFYTYREYLAPTELLRLLTLRFDWALAEPTSAQDEARRRIVRVRSYVTIKYWLLHHFEFDFLPNRELRQALARWLNQVVKDERLHSRPADLGIIKSLRKIVRSLKATYAQNGVGALLYNDSGRVQPSPQTTEGEASTADSGKENKDATDNDKEQVSSPAPSADDVDLSFAADEVEDSDAAAFAAASAASTSFGKVSGSRHASGSEAVMAIRAAALKAAAESVVLSPNRQVSTPRMKASPTTHSPGAAAHMSRPPPLPHAHNTLSRVFVQTVGRLSRFKRVLGNRSTLLPTIASSDANHEDLEFEANDSGDLLFIRGGLESFMQYFDIDGNADDSSSGPSPASGQMTDGTRGVQAGAETEGEDERDCQVSDGTAMEETPSLSNDSVNHSTPASSIDLTPRSIDTSPERTTQAKHELGLGIQGVASDLSSDFGDCGESAQPTSAGSLDLELSALGSLSASKHLRRAPDNLHHTTSDQTLRSFSAQDDQHDAGSIVELPARRGLSRASSRRGPPSMRWSVKSHVSGPRIVQIDDIDLSSDEDDGAVRRALRRLPGARDLRMANTVRDLEPVRQSIDSMASSFAFVKSADTASVHHLRPASVESKSLAPPSQQTFGIVQSEMLDPDEALQGYELVKGFQLDGFDSDDDEPGDVEAALRRLEGIIDEDKQREKAKRVEALWQKSLARNAGEDQSGTRSSAMAPSTDLGSHPAEVKSSSHPTSSAVPKVDRQSYSSSASLADNEEDRPEVDRARASVVRRKADEGHTETADKMGSFLDLADDSSSAASQTRRESRSSSLSFNEQRSPAPSVRPALPTELTQDVKSSRTVSRAQQVKPQVSDARFPALPMAHSSPRMRKKASQYGTATSRMTMPNRLGSSLHPPPPIHRSFLLAYKSDVIARQMCLIEAELLQAVSWDELAGSRWKERRFKAEVTDWESFYRERVRDRLEAQKNDRVHRECAVEAIVARFNLTSNWVASEVVLTQNLDERVAVVSKFIRIALRCYLQCNFASLAQIIFGLSTPWIERLRRTWSRVGYYEMRIWRDLKSFLGGPKTNFRHIRNAMQNMVVDAGIEDLVSGSAGFGGVAAGSQVVKQGCIPFFGVLLSDLMLNDVLPSHLDPSSPNSAPSIDPETGKLTALANPDAFDHLAPLPAGIELEPLINMYKFRIVASTIKNVLAFQDRAKAYNYEADAGVYVKCLKIRCLQGEQLAKVSHAAEP